MTKVDLPYLHVFIDRYGNERCYFRYRGRRWPLPLPADAKFGAAYEARLRAIKESPRLLIAGKVKFIKGTIGWCIEQFVDSDEYRVRAPKTKENDKRILDFLRTKYGAGLVRDLTSKNTKAIRNDIAKTFTDSTADIALGLISVIWEFADERLDLDGLDANPTVGISRLHKTRKEHEPWPQQVIEAFDKAAKPKIKLARLLAFYTGQRRSDIVTMDWARFDGEMIEVRQIKTDELLSIPCHYVLRQALEAIPPADRVTGPILKSQYGTAYTAPGLADVFRETLKRIGARGYSIHGLRKNAADALAEAGCTDREIMAITGHKTAAMVTKYTRRADQRRRAKSAVRKWETSDELANRRTKGG